MAQFHISKDPSEQRGLAFADIPGLTPKTKIPSAIAGIQFTIANYLEKRRGFLF